MKVSRSTEIKVGVVTIAAIILFIIGITLGKEYNVSVRHQTIKFRFANSSGIEQSSPVVVNGVRRGTVNSIVNDNNSVLITADIDGVADLKSDLSAKIMIMELTGGKKIQIHPGNSTEKFNPQNEILGSSSADLAEIISMMGDVSNNLISMIKRMDTLTIYATNALSDGKMIEQVKNTLNNASQMTESLNDLIKNNKANLELTINNLKSLTQDLKATVQKNEPKVSAIVDKLDNTLGSTQELMKKADNAVENANKLLTEFNQITNDVRNGNGLASRLIYDKNLSLKVDSTLNELNLLVKQIKQYGINANVRLGAKP